jgi:endonuclease/exonuclease/phosphatase (EEP) superfamily protein YafD
MGFSFALRCHRAPAADSIRLRVMSLNRGGQPLDAARLIDLIERERIQLICFQEGPPNRLMYRFYKAGGWHCEHLIASRFPIVAFEQRLPAAGTGATSSSELVRARIRVRPDVEIILASAHLDTPRHGLLRLLAGDVDGTRRSCAERVAEVGRVLASMAEVRSLPILLGGDFNMPSDSATFAPLRRAFRSAFESAGRGYGYTRPVSFPWIRIDHLLASPHWRFIRCWVGPDVGSDHLPLIADVVLEHPGDSAARQ